MSVSKPTPKRLRVAGVPGLYQRPKDGKFEHGFTGPDSRWHIVTLQARTKTDAKLELADRVSKLGHGDVVAPSRLKLAEVWVDFESMFAALVASGERSERTLDLYRQRWRSHIEPRMGRMPIQTIRAEHIARMLQELREQGKAPWTSRGVLIVLSSLMSHALTRGLIAESPLRRLSRAERPKARNRSEARILSREEIESLIAHATPTYQPLVACLAYSGLRLSEALGLTWEDIDFDAQEIHVRYQLSRAKQGKPAKRIALKTDAARRDVVLLPQLASVLREHRRTLLASGHHRPEGFVFLTEAGTPVYYRLASEHGLGKAAERAGLNRDGLPRLSAHDLRHSYASHLIRAGVDPYSVSRQLGHSKPSVTLDIYAGEFEKAKNSHVIRERLTAAFGIGPAGQ